MEPLDAVISLPDASQLPDRLKIRLRQTSGEIIAESGKLYLTANGRVFCCPDDRDGRAILEAIGGPGAESGTAAETATLSEIWKRCLKYGDMDSQAQLAEKYRVKRQAERCVLLFQSRQEGEKLRLQPLTELAPTNENEVLIEISQTEAALVRDAEEQALEDITEYAQAVAEFAESEIGLSLAVGIGRICDSLSALHSSYLEAAEAIRTGRQFHLTDTVHVYQKQILERLLSSVPEEQRALCRKQIFNEKTERLLNDEMMETVRVFFENDLNLSTTARQLYLHRNTLTYRLDRIRRETGLDLRSFKDAAAFKAIMECPGEENTGTRKGG